MKLIEKTQIIIKQCKSRGAACAFRASVRSLVDYLGYDPDIETITPAIMVGYAGWLQVKAPGVDRGAGRLSVATQGHYLKTLRGLFNKFIGLGWLVSNPMQLVTIPRPDRNRVRAISRDNQQKMIRAARWNVRDLAILRLYAATGARLSEFTDLTIGDLSFDNLGGRARIMGKGCKSRVIFFGKTTAAAVLNYLEFRNAGPTKPLFVTLTRNAQPIGAAGIRYIFYRYAQAAGVPSPYNPHSFRHAFAKGLIANGADIRTVADLMGHDDPTFTARVYLQWTEDELAGRHAQFAPVD